MQRMNLYRNYGNDSIRTGIRKQQSTTKQEQINAQTEYTEATKQMKKSNKDDKTDLQSKYR